MCLLVLVVIYVSGVFFILKIHVNLFAFVLIHCMDVNYDMITSLIVFVAL